MEKKHIILAAAALVAWYMYQKTKEENYLNDRYPMAYKS